MFNWKGKDFQIIILKDPTNINMFHNSYFICIATYFGILYISLNEENFK